MSNELDIDTRWYRHDYKIVGNFVALESMSFIWYHHQRNILYGDIDGNMK